MTRIFLGFAILAPVVFTTIAFAAPVPKQANQPILYHPTQVGTKWVYTFGTEDETHAITDTVETVDGTVVNVVDVDDLGVGLPWHKLLVSGTGITRIEMFGTKLDPPDTLVRTPGKRGDTWEINATGKRDGLDPLRLRKDGNITVIGKRKVEMAEERINVPAGAFTAIRVEADLAWNGNPRQSTAWYAPGVGLVKLVSGNIEKVLKSFTLGKQ
jgi:hypothetical protein